MREKKREEDRKSTVKEGWIGKDKREERKKESEKRRRVIAE